MPSSTLSTLESFLANFPVSPPDAADNWRLARDLCSTYQQLALSSPDQFIPTPLLDTHLPTGRETGRCLAIDIGGSNLRVGVIELLSPVGFVGEIIDLPADGNTIRKSFEMEWHIEESFKNGSPDVLFAWIGACMAEVIGHEKGFADCASGDELFVGVSFSFPMIQESITEAKIMSMSKGYTLSTDLDLGHLLIAGYERHRTDNSSVVIGLCRKLPKLRIAAIVNDAVATFVTANYQMKTLLGKKVHMSFICATGGNATVSMPVKDLGSSKLPGKLAATPLPSKDAEVIVNTEWAMRGGSISILSYITKWDMILDKDLPIPGQQPFDYMTAGRYLGELARIMALDFFANEMHIRESELPAQLTQRYGVTTVAIGQILATASNSHEVLNPHDKEHPLAKACQLAIPAAQHSTWKWDYENAMVLREIAWKILQRATLLMAGSIVGMMLCINSLKSKKILDSPSSPEQQELLSSPKHRKAQEDAHEKEILPIGYTGGCIMHFPHYLTGVQDRVDRMLDRIRDEASCQKIVFVPVHDGGILGAGILACKAASEITR